MHINFSALAVQSLHLLLCVIRLLDVKTHTLNSLINTLELEELVLEFILLLGVRSKHKMVLDIWEKYLVSRLKFIRQIAEFMPGFGSEEEEILDVLKQLADYNITAKTVRKIERKYYIS